MTDEQDTLLRYLSRIELDPNSPDADSIVGAYDRAYNLVEGYPEMAKFVAGLRRLRDGANNLFAGSPSVEEAKVLSPNARSAKAQFLRRQAGPLRDVLAALERLYEEAEGYLVEAERLNPYQETKGGQKKPGPHRLRPRVVGLASAMQKVSLIKALNHDFLRTDDPELPGLKPVCVLLKLRGVPNFQKSLEYILDSDRKIVTKLIYRNEKDYAARLRPPPI